jgi:hypothetical protein
VQLKHKRPPNLHHVVRSPEAVQVVISGRLVVDAEVGAARRPAAGVGALGAEAAVRVRARPPRRGPGLRRLGRLLLLLALPRCAVASRPRRGGRGACHVPRTDERVPVRRPPRRAGQAGAVFGDALGGRVVRLLRGHEVGRVVRRLGDVGVAVVVLAAPPEREPRGLQLPRQRRAR